MSHPFEKIFDKALKKSINSDTNEVQREAEKLILKGYSAKEVCGVLMKLEKSLIDDGEASLVREVREELCDEDA